VSTPPTPSGTYEPGAAPPSGPASNRSSTSPAESGPTSNGIIASVEHGLSNNRLEGINAKIRLINKRGHGRPNYESLTATIHLCLVDITIPLPTER
jgi:hypothetical protein